MKKLYRVLLALTAGLLFSSSGVQADPHHGGRYFGHGHRYFNPYPRFGFYWGAPVWPRAYYYPDPYYQPYYPPAVVTVPPPSPPVYIERSPPVTPQQPLANGYWYYCSNPEGYYPYVNDCPSGWRQVDPTPPR